MEVITGKQTKPIGRFLRVITGAVLALASLSFLIRSSLSFLLRTFSVLLLIGLFYTLVYIFVTRYFTHVNRLLDAAIANLPILLMFILGIPGGLIFGAGEGQLAAMLYMGVSLLILGIKADPGCEVMLLPFCQGGAMLVGMHKELFKCRRNILRGI